MRSAYDILGVSPDATGAAIRSAYRKLAKIHHPDTNEGDETARERFLEIRAAYEILSNPDRRALYDRAPHETLEDQILVLRRARTRRRRMRLMKLY